MNKRLWIERFIELLSRRVCKGKSRRISKRAGNACAKYANEHHDEAVRAWNKGK